jgi:AcrR family transcriptional regulator
VSSSSGCCPRSSSCSTKSTATSTFYRYFKDKNDLLLAVSEPALEQIGAAALRPWQLAPGAGRADFEAALGRAIETYSPHVALMGAMVEASTYDAQVKERFRSFFDAVRDAVAEHIREGQRQGLIRRDHVHPEETAGWITWMAERGMNQLVPGADAAALQRLTESLATLIWRGVYNEREGT